MSGASREMLDGSADSIMLVCHNRASFADIRDLRPEGFAEGEVVRSTHGGNRA